MADDTHVNRGGVRSLCEALFSLNLAYAGTSMILAVPSAAFSKLVWMEYHINELLHIRNTDFIRGHFMIWIPSVCVAVLLWILLRLLSDRPFATRTLPSAMGITILFAPATFGLFLFLRESWPIDWLLWAGLAGTTICAALLTSGKWKWSIWAAWVLLIAHYWFWYSFAPSSDFYSPDYNGPAGPTLGLCAALAWSAYFKRLRGADGIQAQAT